MTRVHEVRQHRGAEFMPGIITMQIKSKLQPGRSSRQAKRVAFCVMGLLALITVILVNLQARFDPLDWREQPGRLQASQGAGAAPPADRIIGLTGLSSTESYTPETLSDKINGKAELYLDAGFRKLESRRFALTRNADRWMERYVYTMAGHPNAFSVFSSQRRQDIVLLDITAYAYLASNGLFFVHGPYYVEIISGEKAPDIQAAMKELALAFIASRPVQSTPLVVPRLFPPDWRVAHSVALVARSAFGIDSLNWVYTAAYADGERQAIGFIAPCASAGQAEEQAGVFLRYWVEYGGEKVASPESAGIVTILDTYEIAAVQGNYLYGVHEASHLDFALALAAGLRQAVGGKSHVSK